MREYFRGWKRKVGVATLGLACVLMAAWVASLTQAVNLDVYLGGGLQAFAIARGQLFLAFVTRAVPPGSWIDYDLNPLEQFPADVWDGRDIRWRMNAGFMECGLCFAESDRSIDVCLFVVSLWSIVLPLTLISAWLLLFKPRKTQSNTASAQAT